jgi:hypothetical protein
MRQSGSKNKYRFNMQVSACPMAAFGTVRTSGNAAKKAKTNATKAGILGRLTSTCF